MPFDISLADKKIGSISKEKTLFSNPDDSKILSLLRHLPEKPATGLQQCLGRFFRRMDEKKCLGHCSEILGAAQYREDGDSLICFKLWSRSHGPLMVLALAKIAKDRGLVMRSQGPLSEEARTLLLRLQSKPVPNLTVRPGVSDEFVCSYSPIPEIEEEFRKAYARFGEQMHLSSDDPGHHEYMHTRDGLARSLSDTYLSKAALAHH